MNKYIIIVGAFSDEKQVKNYAKRMENDGYPAFIIKNDESGLKKVEKTTKELADQVMKLGLNGEARKKYLGNRYQEVQNYINKR